jgi:RNA polymerase sigma-70 factor (ECF subfamily)
LEDVPDGDAALGWLYGVARRTLANEFRRNRRWRRLLTRLRGTTSGPNLNPENVVVRRDRDATVLAALARLRPQDEELLRLALWEELPHAEIGALLGCSTQAVTQRVYRATRKAAREYRRLTQEHPVVQAPRQLREGETR